MNAEIEGMERMRPPSWKFREGVSPRVLGLILVLFPPYSLRGGAEHIFSLCAEEVYPKHFKDSHHVQTTSPSTAPDPGQSPTPHQQKLCGDAPGGNARVENVPNCTQYMGT